MTAIPIDPKQTYTINGKEFDGNDLIKYMINGMRFEVYKNRKEEVAK